MFDYIVRVKIMVVAAAILAATPFVHASDDEANDFGFVHVGTPLPDYFLNISLDPTPLIGEETLLNRLNSFEQLNPNPLMTAKDIPRVGALFEDAQLRFLCHQDRLKELLSQKAKIDPQLAVAFLLTCFKQWDFLQKQGYEIVKRIRQLQQDTTDNHEMLEHMRLNPTLFPTGPSTAASTWDYLTKDVEKSRVKGHEDEDPAEAKSALFQGVSALQAHLDKLNNTCEAEIQELKALYGGMMVALTNLKYKLNSDDVLSIMTRARVAAEEGDRELNHKMADLGDRLKQHLLDMLLVYNDRPETSDTELMAKIHNAKDAGGYEDIYHEIEKKYFTHSNLSNPDWNRSSEMLARKFVAAVLELRACLHTRLSTHNMTIEQIQWLRSLPRQVVLSTKARANETAVEDLLKDRRNENLLNALHTLQNGLHAEMVQIANNAIEEKMTGFTAENFVRWVLVNKTQQLVPLIAQSAISYCQARLTKLEPRLLEQQSAVKLLTTNGRTSATTVHFPNATELQNSKGRVADALACMIQNLPRECFIGEIEKFVIKTLEESDRKDWVKSVGGYMAAYAAGKLFDTMQQRIIGHIQEKAGDPSLLPLSSDTIDSLLAARAADGHDQTAVIRIVDELRQEAITGLAEQLTNLGLHQQEKPYLVTTAVSSAWSYVPSFGGLLFSEYINNDNNAPKQTVDWEGRNSDLLSHTRVLLLTHIEKLNNARHLMRGKQVQGEPRIRVLDQ